MMRLTVEGASASELRKALLGAAAALGGETAEDAEPTKRDADAAKKTDAKKANGTRKPPEPEADDGPDYETEVRPKVVALSKDFGRDAAMEVLGRFTNPATDEPCTKGAEVDPADYPKLLSDLKKERKRLEAEAE